MTLRLCCEAMRVSGTAKVHKLPLKKLSENNTPAANGQTDRLSLKPSVGMGWMHTGNVGAVGEHEREREGQKGMRGHHWTESKGRGKSPRRPRRGRNGKIVKWERWGTERGEGECQRERLKAVLRGGRMRGNRDSSGDRRAISRPPPALSSPPSAQDHPPPTSTTHSPFPKHLIPSAVFASSPPLLLSSSPRLLFPDFPRFLPSPPSFSRHVSLSHGQRVFFARAGYPTIATIGGFFIFAYTIFYSATKTGYGAWRNHALWFFFNFWLWLFGLFLVFGPDSLAAYSYGGYTTLNGPRAAILGLQLMVQAAIGAFAIFSANAYASLVFALVGIFNELGLIGSLFFFNYNQPIWTLDSTQCNVYFEGNDYQPYITRCDDSGYLEFLRVIGTLEIIVNGYLIVVSLLAYATAIPAHMAGAAPVGYAGPPGAGAYGGAPAAAGMYAPATTTTAAYNAERAPYAAPTAGPGFVAQGQPTISQPTSAPYTTTTSVPTTQI